MRKIVWILALCALWTACPVFAEVSDPLDPFDSPYTAFDEDDSKKSAQDLLEEGRFLLNDDRPLDARSKLLKALKKSPDLYEAHILLAGYYFQHVGHFRLALKYAKQAQRLFEVDRGPPPYTALEDKLIHARLLHLIAEIRLNLDNYEGALETLDEYASYDYFQDWYPASRAWVLMKLGKIDEAIKVARMGYFLGADPSRTLNMLGILLSMSGNRKEALDVLKRAINFELAMGEMGQPATPLNNSGEVFRELFEERKAEQSFQRAVSMHDGCQHVLPSLWIVIQSIEELQLKEAKRAIDNFESCFAQFPLRNGEEHKALVHLARGRIALHAGQSLVAIRHLEAALDRRQWFGKIGTNEKDLFVAAASSLADALRARNNAITFIRPQTINHRLDLIEEGMQNAVRSWWLSRRARQVLTEDLSEFEDIHIRHTDSLLEYPTLGRILVGLPASALQKRIDKEKETDRRTVAQTYYTAYLAENYLSHFGKGSEGQKLLQESLRDTRDQIDALLRMHLRMLLLKQLSLTSKEYVELATEVFADHPPSLRNYGFRLPVRFQNTSSPESNELQKAIFLPDASGSSPFSLTFQRREGSYEIAFHSDDPRVQGVQVTGPDLRDAVNKLVEVVFTQEL